MGKKLAKPEPQDPLFDLAPYPLIAVEKAPPNIIGDRPLWTEAKAQMIARYLRTFVYVTKHGTYIDCFSGPQAVDHSDTWAVKLVLESEPKLLRKFFLFEQDPSKIEPLRNLAKLHGKSWRKKGDRKVEVMEGDCNVRVPEYLKMHRISPKEATFALLDQRTFECTWDLVKCLASNKTSGNKIELFYFLAQGWIDRAAAKLKVGNQEKLERWWGGQGWKDFVKMKKHDRCQTFARRFTEELGYKSALAFPIRKKADSGKVMFWMIHATDHAVARDLMVSAFNNTVLGKAMESDRELSLLAEQIKASNPGLF